MITITIKRATQGKRICTFTFLAFPPLKFTKQLYFLFFFFSIFFPRRRPASFRWPSVAKLRKHMTTHDVSRQKICDQCGKTFRCNTSMRKHVEAEHSDVKPEPQKCTICNTWYRNLSGLRTHQKFLHENLSGENRCHICNKVSSNYRALRRHIYLNHECEKKFKCHMCEKAFKREQDLRVSSGNI